MDHDRFVARVIEESENRIHEDGVARRFGFAGALVPGVELFARATTPLVSAWGEQFLAGGRIDVRFRRPVYDGEQCSVRLDGDQLVVSGSDGDVRCTGSAAPVGGPLAEAPDAVPPLVRDLVDDPVPGPMGTFTRPVTAQENAWYVDAIGEPLPLYAAQALAHPGVLLRLVNELLMRTMRLGPWIHTGSDCRFLALARVPADVTVCGEVVDVSPRRSGDAVRYTALVRFDDVPVLSVDHTALYRLRS